MHCSRRCPHNAIAGDATMKLQTMHDVHVQINAVSYQYVVIFKCLVADSDGL
jgi:hypothetical protein